MISAQLLTRCLSIREWALLCGFIDRTYGKAQAGHTLLGSGWNDNQMAVAEYHRTVDFRVIDLVRNETTFKVKVWLMKSRRFIWIDCTDIRDKNKEEKAA